MNSECLPVVSSHSLSPQLVVLIFYYRLCKSSGISGELIATTDLQHSLRSHLPLENVLI